MCCNRYPVTPYHFLVVKAADSLPSKLPQYIQGPEELEDMLWFLQMAGEPFRAYFNSNRGSDGSASGSSVNHWHYQLFPFPKEAPSQLFARKVKVLAANKGLKAGIVPDWPAHHLFFDLGGGGIHEASERLWEKVRELNSLNVAYNIEVVALPGGAFRAFLFPRKPAAPLEVPGVGSLSPDFGGWELSGDIVVPTREILDWVRLNPGEAARLTEKRLRETTRPVA